MRIDPAIKMAVGRLPQEGLELASQPSVSRLENIVTLRPGKRSSGKETVGYLKRIVKRIREHWANTIIVFRGDGDFSSPEVFDYIEGQDNMFCITGLSANNKLLEQVQTTIKTGKALYERQQSKVKLYHSFRYRAGSWSQARKVVAKVEVSEKGLNVRFISTDMLQAKASALYENIYCARGNMELRIKDHKTYTKSDRTSWHRFSANQFRLFLHSAAYVLLYTLRTQLLKGTELANATIDTLRLKLLKLGARIVEIKTKIKVHLTNSYPFRRLLKRCFYIFDYIRQQSNIVQIC